MKKACIHLLVVFSMFSSANFLLAEENLSPASGTVSSASSAISETGSAAMKKAAQNNKFFFLLVRDRQDEQFSSVKKQVESASQKLSEKAVWFELDRSKAEKELLETYELNRAPMPLVLVIAPNGAVTAGLIGSQVTAEKLEEAVQVSSGLQSTLKALQLRKLVFLCVQNKDTKSNEAAMQGVNEFKADPRFAQNVEIVQLDPANPQEEKFLSTLKIDTKTTEAVTAFLAPPGAAIAVFTGPTTKEKIEAALISATSGGCGSGGCGPSGCGS